jgi:hypothetical protein
MLTPPVRRNEMVAGQERRLTRGEATSMKA